MKINRYDEICSSEVTLDGAKNVTMKILIGQDDGSENMIMRHFTVRPGGHTPLHRHDYEHVVTVGRNKGIAVDENGKEYEITKGNSIFVKPNEQHQFKNPFNEDFEFICIIPVKK